MSGYWSRIKVPEKGHPLVISFFNALNERRVPWKVLCDRAGLGRGTIYRWRTVTPGLANFEAAINSLGGKLVIVWEDDK